MKKIKTTDDLERIRDEILNGRDPDKPCITICSGTGCQAFGCDKVTDAFRAAIKK